MKCKVIINVTRGLFDGFHYDMPPSPDGKNALLDECVELFKKDFPGDTIIVAEVDRAFRYPDSRDMKRNRPGEAAA